MMTGLSVTGNKLSKKALCTEIAKIVTLCAVAASEQ